MKPQYVVKSFFEDQNNHSGIWLSYLAAYVSMPNKAKNAQAFAALDAWYHALDVSRGFITKEELVGIMKWKLMRGKMRPLLKQSRLFLRKLFRFPPTMVSLSFSSLSPMLGFALLWKRFPNR